MKTVDDRRAEVAALHELQLAMPFPDCRGEDVDGVDLVLVDADLEGCVRHFLGKPFRSDDFQRRILRRLVSDLDRIVPQMTGEARRYFESSARLAHATLRLAGE